MLPKSPRDDRFGDQLMADLEDSGTPNSADYNGTFDDLLEDEEEAVPKPGPDMDQTDTLRALLVALEAEKKKSQGLEEGEDEELVDQEEVYDYFLDAHKDEGGGQENKGYHIIDDGDAGDDDDEDEEDQGRMAKILGDFELQEEGDGEAGEE